MINDHGCTFRSWSRYTGLIPEAYNYLYTGLRWIMANLFMMPPHIPAGEDASKGNSGHPQLIPCSRK